MPYLITPFNIIHVFGLGSWVLMGLDLLRGGTSYQWPKSLIFLSASYLVAALYVLLVKTVNQVPGAVLPDIYRFIVISLEFVPISIVMSRILMKRGYASLDFLKLIVNVSIIQSLIAFLMIGFSGFRSSMFAIMKGNGLDVAGQAFFEYRAFGLTSGYTFAMPVFMAAAAIIAWYLGLCKSRHYLVAVPVILGAAIVNARISIFLALLGMLVVLAYAVKRREIKHTKYLIATITTTGLIVFYVMNYIISEYPGMDTWISAAFTETSAVSGGESVGTFAALKGMLHFPSGAALFFGEGISVFGGLIYGIPESDIGYVGDAYMGGLILHLLLYLPVIYLAIKAIEGDSIRKLINIVLILMFIIGNVKGAMVGVKEWFIGFLLIETFFLLDAPMKKMASSLGHDLNRNKGIS